MAEAIADRLAEAFAECLHKRVRDEWGYGRAENLTPEELIHEKYRGIRPAPGYPACPDHTEKGTIWRLLDVQANTGMMITESYAMWPGSSVSGLYFAHPESRYFSLGKIDRDQVADYAERKGMSRGRGRALAGAKPQLRAWSLTWPLFWTLIQHDKIVVCPNSQRASSHSPIVRPSCTFASVRCCALCGMRFCVSPAMMLTPP